MIKLSIIFILFNLFLVWMAKKVLAKYNLDLVFIEYYTEKPKSRLKNKKTHTKEAILPELNKSARL